MKPMKTSTFPAIIMALAALTATAPAATLNYDPTLPTPQPVLDAGWAYDGISLAFVDSDDSPYVYNLGAPAVFTITDDFVPGDTFYVYDFGTLILTTSVTAGGVPYSGGGGPAYGWGSVTLSPGAHQLSVQGDGGGGVPAGFYTRLDSVKEIPDAGSTLALAGIVLSGMIALRRKLR